MLLNFLKDTESQDKHCSVKIIINVMATIMLKTNGNDSFKLLNNNTNRPI